MAQKVLVNGTAYDLKPSPVLINGTKYQIGGGRTLINGTGYDIKLQGGTPLSDIPVGNTVKIAVNGTMRDWLVVNQGIPSGSTLYDDSCRGTWLLMKDIYEKREWNNRKYNSYGESIIHSYLNGEFLNLLDSNIRAAVKRVKIPYINGPGDTGTAQVGASGLPVKIFLLSAPEVGLKNVNATPSNGGKLDYFNESTTEDSKRTAYLNGSPDTWWLRSPYTAYSGTAWRIIYNGYPLSYNVTEPFGIRPAMILPFETLVADDGTILA